MCGKDALEHFIRQTVVDFLWALGVLSKDS
jgi:hypothetical protein